jgi:hypothetical protein
MNTKLKVAVTVAALAPFLLMGATCTADQRCATWNVVYPELVAEANKISDAEKRRLALLGLSLLDVRVRASCAEKGFTVPRL